MENKFEEQEVTKIKQLIDEVGICMLVTTHDSGKLSSRPMATIQVDDDGNVWFFTNEYSETIHEASQNNSVSLIYSHPGKNTYAHINGFTTIVLDKAKIKELWNPSLKIWFPEGVEDPKLCLLKVIVKEIHFWNSSSNKMVTFFNMVKAIATGNKYDEGESGSITIAN